MPDNDFIIENGVLKKYVGKDKYVVVPDGVKQIKNEAFRKCVCVEEIVLPDSVQSLGKYTFKDCGIKRITLSSSITEIPTSAFEGCTELTEIIILSNIKKIGHHAFCNCKNLESVIFKEGLEKIDGGAFSGCVSLASLYLPNTVNYVSATAFEQSCIPGAGMTTMELSRYSYGPNSKKIPGCKNIEILAIPNNAAELGMPIFDGCDKLDSVTGLTIIKTDSTTYFFDGSEAALKTIINHLQSIFCDEFTIYAPANSTAAIYAINNKFNFKETPKKMIVDTIVKRDAVDKMTSIISKYDLPKEFVYRIYYRPAQIARASKCVVLLSNIL